MKVIFQCECGRKNKIMATYDILVNDPEDTMELRAWKQTRRKELRLADKWYKEQREN